MPAQHELRSEGRGFGFGLADLAQLWYEYKSNARQMRGDILSQVVANVNEPSLPLPTPTSSPPEQEVARSRKHRSYFAFSIWPYVRCAEWKNRSLQMH